jgi:hypothetical protein
MDFDPLRCGTYHLPDLVENSLRNPRNKESDNFAMQAKIVPPFWSVDELL